tara:strand:- start:201 stop:863 length:663 start_codon:yes stop_codon:yes gene_type:complete
MHFFNSSIGRKVQIALSGLLLSLFLIFHLSNNLILFLGKNNFNNMVSFLESIKPIIRVMEFGLLFIIIIHVLNSIILTIKNKRIRTEQYSIYNQKNSSSLNSRTMIFSGTTILFFLIFHLWYIWGSYQAHSFVANETYYDLLLREEFGYLNHFWTACFYIISIILISFHLKHGFESAFKSLGITKSSNYNLISKISFIFWGVVPFGFIIIIIAIQMKYIQ